MLLQIPLKTDFKQFQSHETVQAQLTSQLGASIKEALKGWLLQSFCSVYHFFQPSPGGMAASAWLKHSNSKQKQKHIFLPFLALSDRNNTNDEWSSGCTYASLCKEKIAVALQIFREALASEPQSNDIHGKIRICLGVICRVAERQTETTVLINHANMGRTYVKVAVRCVWCLVTGMDWRWRGPTATNLQVVMGALCRYCRWVNAGHFIRIHEKQAYEFLEHLETDTHMLFQGNPISEIATVPSKTSKRPTWNLENKIGRNFTSTASFVNSFLKVALDGQAASG